MKKFLTLLLALGTVFAFGACGDGKTANQNVQNPPSSSNPPVLPVEKNTVTEAEWEKAMSFDVTDISYVSLMFGAQTETFVDGDKGIIYTKEADGKEVFYAKETDGCYRYIGRDGANWAKSSMEEAEYNYVLNATRDMGVLFVYSDFTYNEETKVYEADSLSTVSGVTYASVQFINGKVKRLKHTSEGNEFVFTFSYGDVTLTLPVVEGANA